MRLKLCKEEVRRDFRIDCKRRMLVEGFNVRDLMFEDVGLKYEEK